VKTLYAELADRLRGEVEDLDRAVRRALRSWEWLKVPGADQAVYLDSTALNLHSFYSGLERLFELIARYLDGNLPSGETWHRDLLQAMACDVADVRPALIDPDSATALDEFRRFRHLVRNVYTANLVPEKAAGLLRVLPALWPKLREELLAFAGFLEQLAQAGDVT